MGALSRRPGCRRRVAVGVLAALLAVFGGAAGGCGWLDRGDRKEAAGRTPPAASGGAGPASAGPTASGTGRLGAAPSATGSATAPAPPAPTGSAPAGRWRPGPVASWQWQLAGELDLSVPAQVYELDAFTTSAAQVARLHADGRRAICYVNAGAYEQFRADARRYPAGVLGRPNGWQGERWLDIRRWDLLQPILTERLQTCRSKGFDGVEADNVDGYANDSGFPLTAADQLTFNRRVARLAHDLDLAIGLKNDLDQVTELQPDFDFAVNEECFRYDECESLAVFIRAGKPVFHVEYDVAPERFCPSTRRLGFASMRKNLVLDAARWAC